MRLMNWDTHMHSIHGDRVKHDLLKKLLAPASDGEPELKYLKEVIDEYIIRGG